MFVFIFINMSTNSKYNIHYDVENMYGHFPRHIHDNHSSAYIGWSYIMSFIFFNTKTSFMDIFMFFLFLFFQNIPQIQYSPWLRGIGISSVFVSVPCFYKEKKNKKKKNFYNRE